MLGPEEIIDRDYFAAGEKITLSGTINGDAYLAGEVVIVDGRINGDLLVLSGTFTLLGEVSDDVRVAAGQANIEGKVGKSLTLLSGNAGMARNAEVKNSLLALSGNLEILGSVGREANLLVGQALLGGPIGGDFKGWINDLTLTSSASVAGNLEYQGSQKGIFSPEASVSGKIAFSPREKGAFSLPNLGKYGEFLPGGVFKNASRPEPKKTAVFRLFGLAIAYFFGFGFLRLWPQKTREAMTVLKTKPFKSFLLGFVSPGMVFGLALLFSLTVLGIPLAFFLILTFVFLAYLAKTFLALYIGQKILIGLGHRESEPLALLAGLLVYYLLRFVPGVRFLTVIIFAFLGLGALVLSFGTKKAKKSKKNGI